MVRGWLMAGAVLLIAMAAGCGKSPMDDAPRAKPSDIGLPEKWPMGVTSYAAGQIFVVKEEFEGETRLFALESKVPYAGASLVKYDPQRKVFYDKGRVRTYTLEGIALHTMPVGPNKGQKAPPLRRKRVELDRKTGHVLLYQYGMVLPKDYSNPKKLAYVVVP